MRQLALTLVIVISSVSVVGAGSGTHIPIPQSCKSPEGMSPNEARRALHSQLCTVTKDQDPIGDTVNSSPNPGSPQPSWFEQTTTSLTKFLKKLLPLQ